MKLEKYIPRPDPIPWDISFSPTASSIRVRSVVRKFPVHGTSSKRVNIFFFDREMKIIHTLLLSIIDPLSRSRTSHAQVVVIEL